MRAEGHAPQGRAAKASRQRWARSTWQSCGPGDRSAPSLAPGGSEGTYLCEVRWVVEGHCGPGRALCGCVVTGSLRAERAHLSKTTTAHSALRSVCDTHTISERGFNDTFE